MIAAVRSGLAFRVGLAAVALWDLVQRWQILDPLLTPDGVFPSHAAWPFPSLLGAAPAELALRLFVVLGAVAALGLGAGQRPRLCAGVVFYVLACLNARNPHVLYGAHRLELPLLLAACLPPSNARTGVVWVQLACLYGFSAVAKLADPTWMHLEALRAGLLADPDPGPGAAFLLAHPRLTQVASGAVLALELAAAPLLLVRPTRTPTALALACFHLVAATLLSVGWFSAIACVGLMGLLADPGPATVDRRSRGVALVLASVLLAGNVGAAWPAARVLEWPAVALGVPQGWAMYTGGERVAWAVPVAVTPAGARVDPWTRAPVDPGLPATATRHPLLGVWLETLIDPRAEPLRHPLAAWVCTTPDTVAVELLDADADGGSALLGQWSCPGR